MSDTEIEIDGAEAVYKTLLESTKAIPWKIDWATMKFAYIGPQIEPLLGWSQGATVIFEQRPGRARLLREQRPTHVFATPR
ncbi:MAG: hypothetical protein LCH56_17215, partial [Proteobacteria bacterium]|nr:hypothetical protein [Pseudomonadota bacterium]